MAPRQPPNYSIDEPSGDDASLALPQQPFGSGQLRAETAIHNYYGHIHSEGAMSDSLGVHLGVGEPGAVFQPVSTQGMSPHQLGSGMIASHQSLQAVNGYPYRYQSHQPDLSSYPMQYDIEPHYPTYEPPTMSDPRLSSQAPNARSSSVVDQSNHDVFASGLNRETEFVVPDGGLSNPSFSDASMGPMPNGLGPPEENAPETLADYYKIYQIRLHGTVEKYIVSQLTEAIEQLVEITEWLLTHVEELGLTRDEPHLVTQRRQLWDDLNNTWLIILQRQLEQTTKLAATDPDASFPPNLIPERTLKRAGDKLVALANEVEPHGLVDYQMGIWEEQIIEVLVDCRNVYRDRRASRLSRSPSSVPSSVAAEAGRAAKGSAGGGGASGAAGTVFRPPPDPAAAGTVAGTAAADAELPEGWSAVNPR